MESQRQEENSSQPSEVAKAYEGKSVFITGAAGFIGTILLETLLRCCPGIRHIYILVRPKKGMQPEKRMENILKKPIFCKIKEKCPNVLNKVIVIPGDVTHNNLGMSSEDLHKVIQEVSIVFHVAATVSFVKPLSFMFQQNVIGTLNVIELCRKMKKLDAFAYTSTAYSNSNYMYIEERIYKLPFTAEEIIKAYKTGSEEELMKLYSKCEPKFPNFYTFTKSVSETMIAEKVADLPVVIIRPSIVICCLKGPIPGYIEEGTGLVTLCVGVGKGFIRVLHCDPEKKANHISADVVANTHILGVYRQISGDLPSPFVYNCVSDESKTGTWRNFMFSLFKMVCKHPLPNTFQNPSLTLIKNDVKYKIITLFDHFAPAVVIDSLLWLSGRKPRLVKLYRFYETNMEVTKHFILNEWKFKSENLQSLNDKLNATDKELFPVELMVDYEHMTDIVARGAPMYQKNLDKPEEKLRPKYMPMCLTSLIKWAVLGCLASAFYVALF